MMAVRRLALIATLLAAAACSRPPETPVVVFAAASTVDAVTEVARRYEAAGGQPVLCNFAASSTLARQIIAGADADLYLSADTRWMDELERADRLEPGSRRDLLGNTLVWVAARGRGFTLGLSPDVDPAVALPGRIAVADPEHVPAGRYAAAALRELGWWETLEDRLVPAVDVRAALRLVELGAVHSGIVYATDAAACDVEIIARFEHPAIRYPVALVADASPQARRFLDYLRSGEAESVFAAAGFGGALEP